MSAGDSAEHDGLRQVIREFLSERSPSREVRRLMEAGKSRDDEVWAVLAGQLGLTGIAVPERYGGAGYGPVELGIVLEEMGGALLAAPKPPPPPAMSATAPLMSIVRPSTGGGPVTTASGGAVIVS